MTDHYLSVKQSANVLGINIKTIQTWINKRILVPERVAKPRDPTGHQLSLSDVVTVWVLHALFSHGVKFEDMSRLPAGSFTFDIEGLSQEACRWLSLAEGRSRHIQAYLELLDPPFLAYMLRIDRHFLRGEESVTSGHTFFFPATRFQEYSERIIRTTGLSSHLVLNVGTIHRYISKAIKESA